MKIIRLLMLFITAGFISSIIHAQTDSAKKIWKPWESEGIEWTVGLDWKQILSKAKKENKYIFIDCFATWCGPCKAMEKDVFSKSEVGDFFNEKFISVRLQMDQTSNDNEQTKKLYITARDISNKYGIPSYPTFLYFSPNGQLVQRGTGYLFDKLFIETAKKALEPGMQATYQTYYSALAKYLQGKKDYKTMAGIADTAKMLGQNDIASSVAKEYKPHLLAAKKEEWYSPSNLSFMASFLEGSRDTFFSVFHDYGDLVDVILHQKGFSQNVVDLVIQSEEIDPIVKPQKGVRSTAEKPQEQKEPNWENIKKHISAKYDSNYAQRNVLHAMVQWYNDQHDWWSCARYLTMYLKKYPPPFISPEIATFLNYTSWDAIFKRSVDKDQIDIATIWMGKVVEKFNSSYEVTDTYANLLYKAGKISEAIKYEEMALSNAYGDSNGVRETLKRMNERKPTWPHYISNDFWEGGLID